LQVEQAKRRSDAQVGTSAPSVEEATPPHSAGGALPLVVPRQHGAWSILLISYLIGTFAVTGVGGAAPWLALVALVCGFVARHALVQALALRRKGLGWSRLGLWGFAFGAVSLAGTGALILFYDHWGLLLIGGLAALAALAALVVERYHKDRTAWGEIVGVLGLSTAIPFAAYARAGRLDSTLLGLWLLGALYFAGPVFHVRFLVRSWRARRGPLTQRLRSGWSSLVYHLLAFGAAAGLSALGWTPAWVAAALVPCALKAVWALRAGKDAPPVIRALGFVELAHSVGFAVVLLLAYRA
jgi:hypothetical protein